MIFETSILKHIKYILKWYF